VQNRWEMVRLKAYDLSFPKTIKLCTLPQFQAFLATIEEGDFLKILKIIKNVIFRYFLQFLLFFTFTHYGHISKGNEVG